MAEDHYQRILHDVHVFCGAVLLQLLLLDEGGCGGVLALQIVSLHGPYLSWHRTASQNDELVPPKKAVSSNKEQ
jgi:hypothetical protein